MNENSTILIVDDQESNRAVIESLLADEGYTLVFAGSGEEALTQAMTITPDLVLLDVMMPGMDGFEVCRHLRGDPRLATIPIIIITALEDRNSRLEGIEAGADDFISKPFDAIELRSRVRTITQLNRYRRLNAEQTKFRRVVETADDGYLVTNNSDTILYANSSARHYLSLPDNGREPEESRFLALAAKQYQLKPETTPNVWLQGTHQQRSFYMIRPESTNGNPLWLQAERFSMHLGVEDEFLIHLRDVTAEMVAKKKMWTFHSQIGHKLRTPLTLVCTSLDFLKNNDDDDPLSKQEEDMLLDTASQGALRLRESIIDILRYLETPHLVQVGGSRCVIRQIPAIITDIAADMDLEAVEISPSPDLGSLPEQAGNAYLPLSGQALTLILEELMENSKKFHPRQTPTLQFEIGRTANKLLLRLTDDGPGISAEQFTKIWTPYYQGEKDHTGQITGMGLGLSMVQTLVWESGGECRAYNRETEPGFVVELSFPLANNHNGQSIE